MPTKKKAAVLDRYTPPTDIPLSEHLRVLARPKHRYGEMPDVKVAGVWAGPGGAAMDVQEQKKASEVEAKAEKDAITRWLRKGQNGGVEAVAKELNKSLTYCREKLRGFETTNGKNHWNGVGDKTMNSTHSSMCTTIQF